MKIEICEQMVHSWLLNHHLCQIVQTNWSISPLRNISQKEIDDAHTFMKDIQDGLNALLEDEIKAALQASVDEDMEETMANDEDVVAKKPKKKKKTTLKKLNIIKKSTAGQFIRQCEIDVAGIRLIDNEIDRVFLIDTAFHKQGLGYHDVVATVIKKIVRAVLVAVLIFGEKVNVTVGFAAPECRPAVQANIDKVVNMLRGLLGSKYAKITIEMYLNNDFTNQIYGPLKQKTKDLNNDNDLFMRALNLIQSAEKYAPKPPSPAPKKSATAGSAASTAATPTTAADVPILFTPADPDTFKSELILKKQGEIVWVYSDGTRSVNMWDAGNINTHSNIRGNIQSRSRWRSRKKDGLAEVHVTVL